MLHDASWIHHIRDCCPDEYQQAEGYKHKELRLHETVIKRLYLYERKTITNYCPVNCLDLDIVVLRQFTGQ